MIIVGSLIIGIVVGFLISAQLRHKRMRSVRVMTSERYFRDVLYKVVEPDEVLKSKLEPIIDNYGKEGLALQREFRNSIETHNENYWNAIKEQLSDEQVRELEDFNMKIREERRRFRPDSSRSQRGEWNRKGGPPPGSGHRQGRPDSLKLRMDSLHLVDSIN